MFNTNVKPQNKFSVPPAVLVLVGVVALAFVGVILYLLATNQFIDKFLWLRDAAMLVYMFVFRFGLPIVLLIGIGMWLERKLNPDAATRVSKPLGERYPMLQRIQLPTIPASKTLTYTFLAVLWLVAVGIAVVRFFLGLGYTTNLSDQFPWGIWIAFDVVCGVALAAGGFVMAGTVHVFKLEKYHPIVRPAILTALLGYLLVIVGLLFDLGRWYNVWHPIFGAPWGMANIHSPMLEVGWCVFLYSTVLALEFSPVIFEKFNWQFPLKLVRKVTLPLVILGMCLSTLHQSSLGSLFLIVPEKINPLWYTPWMPVFFFISAVAVGLGMTIVEANLSARGFGRALENDLLQGLGRAASVVLGIYLAAKIADLIWRGAWTALSASAFHTTLYSIEMVLGVIVPMVVLATKRGRENPRTVFISGALIVGGVILNRLNTALLGWWVYVDGSPIYIPAWSELWITISLVSVGVVAFALIAKYFPLFSDEHAHAK